MEATGAERYLNLLKMCLTRYDLEDQQPYVPWDTTDQRGFGGLVRRTIQSVFGRRGLILARQRSVNLEDRAIGKDWPRTAETMIGLRRLDNIQTCVEEVIAKGVPGDLIETGVWRGGSCIFMRGVLAAHGITDRVVWVADSFEGLPKPSEEYPADHEATAFWEYDELAVSREEVSANFAKYGLLDDQVQFLKGWFKDTLPTAPIERIAVLRLDGDMYDSTIQALKALYPKLSIGGYVIVDDYGDVPACKEAVGDFRRDHAIDDEIHTIDWTGVYWQRSK